MKNEYIIPEWNFVELQDRVEKLNTIAHKLGLSGATFVENGVHHKSIAIRYKCSRQKHWVTEDLFNENIMERA